MSCWGVFRDRPLVTSHQGKEGQSNPAQSHLAGRGVGGTLHSHSRARGGWSGPGPDTGSKPLCDHWQVSQPPLEPLDGVAWGLNEIDSLPVVLPPVCLTPHPYSAGEPYLALTFLSAASIPHLPRPSPFSHLSRGSCSLCTCTVTSPALPAKHLHPKTLGPCL